MGIARRVDFDEPSRGSLAHVERADELVVAAIEPLGDA
jgi:hypothetical protein